MIEKYYTIHDIVNFKIVERNGYLKRLFSNVFVQYHGFESPSMNPDIVVNLGDFVPANEQCSILDDTFFIKENYLYCAGDSYKQARWQFQASGFEDSKLSASVSTNLLGGLFVQGVLIDFLIQYEMNRRGFPMIHASGVSKDNRAYVFSARSGGGKTTIALNLLDRGFQFLGDNFVIIHDGEVMSYHSPLNLFTYNLAPSIKRKLEPKEQLVLKLKNALYRLSLGYIKLFTKINVHDVFERSLTDRAQLKAACVIVPKACFEIEHISKAQFIDHVVTNQKLDFLAFMEYAREYSFLLPKSQMARHWERYAANLERGISDDTSFIRVEVPRHYDDATMNRLTQMITAESVDDSH